MHVIKYVTSLFEVFLVIRSLLFIAIINNTKNRHSKNCKICLQLFLQQDVIWQSIIAGTDLGFLTR